MKHIDAIVIKLENGWATLRLKNGTVYDCWNFPRELKLGDMLIFNPSNRTWKVV